MEQKVSKVESKLLLAIFSTGAMTFAGVVSETAMNVAFPTLMRIFSVDTSTVQWLTTGYLLMLALVIPLSSLLKRRFRLKQLFIVAVTLFTVGTLLCATAQQFTWLIVGRLVQGVATGIALPLMFNIILEQAPKDRTGLLIGIASLVVGMAPALGPVLGGFLIDSYGWRMIFWVLIPLLVTVAVVGFYTIRQTGETQKTEFPVGDYLLLALAFGSFIFATEKAASHGWLSLMVIGLLLFAVLMAGLFLYCSSKRKYPLIRIEVFRHRSFVLCVVFILIIQCCVLGLGYLIPNYSQLVSAQPASVAGLLLLPGCLLGALLAPISGQLLDRIGAPKPILGGSICMIVALSLFSFFGLNLTTALFMIFYVVYTTGQAFSVGNTTAFGLRQLPAELSADGNAVLNTLQQLSGAFGTALAASIVASAQHAHTADTVLGTSIGSQCAFVVLLIMLVVAFALVYTAFRIRPSKQTVK